jgi:IS5 family transposase
MEATLPWEAFLALIEPVYHKPSSKGGRPSIPLEVMLRIHLLQQWFTLSDPLMEEMLIDTPCFRRFAGIETMEGGSPMRPRSSTFAICWKSTGSPSRSLRV